MLRLMILAAGFMLLPSLSLAATTANPPLITNPQPNNIITQSSTFSDSCLAPAAGSFANQALSVGINFGRMDDLCEVRKEAKELFDFGYAAAGLRVLCTVPRIDRAMQLSGTPCNSIFSSTAAKPVVVVVNPTTIEVHASKPATADVTVAPKP